MTSDILFSFLPFASCKHHQVTFMSEPTIFIEPPHLAEALHQARISTSSLERLRRQLKKQYHEFLFEPFLSPEHRQKIFQTRFSHE